jgi:hypothetical protein
MPRTTPFGTEMPDQAARTAGRQARPWRPGNFAEWVRYAPSDYLRCFDKGHDYEDDEWAGEHVDYLEDGRGRLTGAIMLYRTCRRCGLPMDRWIGPDGSVNGTLNVYHYGRMEGPGSKHDFPYVVLGMARGKAERRAVRLELRRRDTERGAVPERPVAIPAFSG